MTLNIILSVVGMYEPYPTKFHLHLGKWSFFPLEFGGQASYMETHP